MKVEAITAVNKIMTVKLTTARVRRSRESEEAFASSQSSATLITKEAGKQTYYTVRFLVDRERISDAYRAYAYFRWVDDWLDQARRKRHERMTFVNRQTALIDRCYRGDWPQDVSAEERMLVHLIQNNDQQTGGLRAYIENMMAVMAFDAERKDRLISANELAAYTRFLATAVTEALHYFIGNGRFSPTGEARYLAAGGAHVTHMLRDTMEDVVAGYYNIPGEFLQAHSIDAWDLGTEPYRNWVQSRVNLARTQFQAGKSYLAQVEDARCRLAGYAYIARFETVLDAIEKNHYFLRIAYPECKSVGAGIRMGWSSLAQVFMNGRQKDTPQLLTAHS